MNRDKQEAVPQGFVHVCDAVPDALLDIRYHTTFNFIGERIDGYERPTALLTVEAARALKAVGADVKARGFRLKIYDAYRPVRAVSHFVAWAKRTDDTRMKAYFYPDIDKPALLEQGYIAERSGHSRGSAVDLTLFDMAAEKELDMGSPFDRFGRESHPAWCGDPETGRYTGGFPGDTPPAAGKINETQFRNRMLLRSAMMRRGFEPLAEEWWHFTLADEPYPDIYFDHPVR